MALEILYGKTLKNKDSILFNRIKDCIDRKENVLYIVPEQYSFNADKILIETLGEKYSHLTETVNFKRLAMVVNQKYTPNLLDYIDEEIKNLLLYKIIKENAEQLTTIKNRCHNPDSVMIFKNILSECKGYLVDHDVFQTLKSRLEQDSFLHQKICDLDFILSRYQAEINEKFRDYEDSFQVLADCITANGLYENYHIFIDHFTNFSPAEYLVISALAKNANNMVITLLLDDFSQKETGDLFYPTFQTYNTLKKLAKKLELPLIASVCEENGEEFYAEIFDKITKIKPGVPYSLTNAKNQREEIRFVLDTIHKLVKQGASYRDITVLAGDLSLYQDDLEKSFLQAGVPCFLDQKTPLTQNPLARIFLNLFAMVLSEYRQDAVLEYLKSLCCVYPIHRDVCIFEELICRFHLEKRDLSNPNIWAEKCEFLRTQNNYFAQNIEKIETIYKKFLLPVVEHFRKKGPYLSAFSNFSNALKLEEAVTNYLEEKEASLRKETVTAYNTILTAIKNIDVLIGDDHLSASDYYSIFKQSLELYESGEIPNTLDTVTISDPERGRNLRAPYVFILGMNEGVTPKANNNTSYLSDIERETILDITGIELPTSLSQNCASNLSLYRAFLTAEKQLYLSKNEAESEQAKRMPSYLWNRLANIQEVTEFNGEFVNRTEYTQKAIMAFKNPYKQRLSNSTPPSSLLEGETKEPIRKLFHQLEQMKEADYYSLDKKLSKKLMDSKYQKRLNSSISRLETYQKCGYSYFINYILKISQREDISYDSRKTGSIIHNLLEQFSKHLKKDHLTWETIDESYIETKLEQLVPKEIMRLFPDLSLFNPRTKYLIKKIKRLLRKAIAFIQEHFQNGEFIPVGYEIPLGENGIPPLTIALEDGSVMQMYGTIDRCDAAKIDDRLYVRIVDYKSSKKEFNFALIKEGIQLQLLAYLQTVVKNGGEYLDFAGEILPGAAFYTNFGDSVISFQDRPAPDEVEQKIRNKFAMKGLVLNDDSLIQAIDQQLGESSSYQSKVCEIKTDAKGQYKLKNFLFMEEFKRLLADCENTLQSIGNQMLSGSVPIKPYRYGDETGCSWCPYASVCMFDPKMHSYRNLKKLSKENYFHPEDEETAGDSHGN